MDMLNELSVIVPAYNEEKTIINVLEALLENVPDIFEIIVVDDGSVDKTCQVVDEYSSRLKNGGNIV